MCVLCVWCVCVFVCVTWNQPIDNACYMSGHLINSVLLIQQIIVHYGNEEMRNPVQLSLYERFYCETVAPFLLPC